MCETKNITCCILLLRLYQTLKQFIDQASRYKVKVLRVVYYPGFSGFILIFVEFKSLGRFFSDPDHKFPLDLLDKT